MKVVPFKVELFEYALDLDWYVLIWRAVAAALIVV